ncbi:Gfo/Idh/MocA family oxidoreductase [Candidatus Aerophobetes bacterium]|nr:Gfo/Idh/MocA family oxidoreductase [Candidatus Aerophobetes bacterium]
MVNVAVAGVGVWGKNVVKNFYDVKQANLLFCYDSNPASFKWVKENYPTVKTVDDYAKVLTNTKIDAVIIATPPHTHFELSRGALDADKHVLVEKPLTLSSRDAAELVELAHKKGKKLMVGHLLRYHPAVLKMREKIETGELGKIFYIQSQRLALGRVRRVENVMWCLATHDVYTAVYLLGRYPEKVIAVGKSFLQKEKGIEDVVFLTLFFDEEVFAHIHTSWIDQEKVRKTKVVGEKKMIVFDELASPICKLKMYDKGIHVEQEKSGINFHVRENNEAIVNVDDKQPLREECLHFIKCIEENSPPLTDGEEGLKVVKVLEAAQRSLKLGEAVDISL